MRISIVIFDGRRLKLARTEIDWMIFNWIAFLKISHDNG